MATIIIGTIPANVIRVSSTEINAHSVITAEIVMKDLKNIEILVLNPS